MRDEPGLFHALSDTISRATDLVQLEFRVFKAELAEKAVHIKSGLALIVAGAILVTAALFLLLQAAVLALVQSGMSPAGATLLVGAACIAASRRRHRVSRLRLARRILGLGFGLGSRGRQGALGDARQRET